MSSVTECAAETNNDRMHAIEGRHFGRCLDQVWGTGRLALMELMDYPKAGCQVVIVKRYESPVPRQGSRKPWPDLLAAYVYVPVDDQTNTWTGLEVALTAFEEKSSK